jgi:hypothetical protein
VKKEGEIYIKNGRLPILVIHGTLSNLSINKNVEEMVGGMSYG